MSTPPSSSEEYGSLSEFRAELAEALEDTLVLANDWRVKTVNLSWDNLPAAHQEVALALIREVAEAEVSAHPMAQVLFEFNAVPPDLADLMNVLVALNPRLRYVENEERSLP